MQITKSKLKKIIKEELERFLETSQTPQERGQQLADLTAAAGFDQTTQDLVKKFAEHPDADRLLQIVQTPSPSAEVTT